MMPTFKPSPARRAWRPLWLGMVIALAACASGPEKPVPADLGPDPALLGVRNVWSVRMGPVTHPLAVAATADLAIVAASDGVMQGIDVQTGAIRWRAEVGEPLSAGIGSDGQVVAAVTRSNQLVVFEGGRERWRRRLTAQVYTAPLVAGERVFVLTAARTVQAFDGQAGFPLWTAQRTGDPLVLGQPGVLSPAGDSLVAGFGGRLVALNPDSGAIRWEAALASPRGTNDVERLVDLVGPVARPSGLLCARAYLATIGCIEPQRGSVRWTRPAQGATGVAADGELVFGTESDGRVSAWRQADGERSWSSERLRHRRLTAPLVLGRSLVVGDDSGTVHLVARQDGTPLKRLSTDGSPIAATPVAAGNTLVVVTRSGGVFGFRPE